MEENFTNDYKKVTAPYFNVPILDYWNEIYECAYCYLKPFLKIKSGSKILEMEFEDYYFDYRLLVEHTTPMPWKEMVKLCGFDSISTLKKALLTNTVSYPLIHILNDVCSREKIIKPYEDKFSPHQLEALIPLLSKLGYKRIKCIPPHPEHELSIVVDLDLDKIIDAPNTRSLQTEDAMLLLANQFDYVETLIAGPVEIIRQLVVDLEGFYCDKSTKARWPF